MITEPGWGIIWLPVGKAEQQHGCIACSNTLQEFTSNLLQALLHTGLKYAEHQSLEWSAQPLQPCHSATGPHPFGSPPNSRAAPLPQTHDGSQTGTTAVAAWSSGHLTWRTQVLLLAGTISPEPGALSQSGCWQVHCIQTSAMGIASTCHMDFA